MSNVVAQQELIAKMQRVVDADAVMARKRKLTPKEAKAILVADGLQRS